MMRACLALFLLLHVRASHPAFASSSYGGGLVLGRRGGNARVESRPILLQGLRCAARHGGRPSGERKQRNKVNQRARIDEVLGLAGESEQMSFASRRLDDAHYELEEDAKVAWGDMPAELDPNFNLQRAPGDLKATTTVGVLEADLQPRSKRKRSQVESFYAALSLLQPPPGARVVDFGSGTGNLVLPLAHLLPHLEFTAVDLNARAVQILGERARAAGLRNVRCNTGAIEEFGEPFSIALGLHVCGPASNAVLDIAIANGAAYLVSPCCIGKLNTQASGKRGGELREFPMSGWLRGAMDRETFGLVAAAADISHVPGGIPGREVGEEEVLNFRRGGLCKTLVELDRLEWTRERGYQAFLLRMRGMEDYPKKDLLVGIPAGGVLDSFAGGLRPGVARFRST